MSKSDRRYKDISIDVAELAKIDARAAEIDAERRQLTARRRLVAGRLYQREKAAAA